MKVISVDVQGFNLKTEENLWAFFPKEITIYNGYKVNHYLLKAPLEFEKLSQVNKKQVRYEENHLLGLRYSNGYFEYDQITNILTNVLKNYNVVYVKGSKNYKFLKQVCTSRLPTLTITDIEVEDNYLKFEKQQPRCFDHFNKGKWLCSNTNCMILHEYVKHKLS